MMKNKISPLDELRQEKEIARREVADSEDRLAEHWAYLSDNAPSLLFNSAVNGIAGWFGFGHKADPKRLNEPDDAEGTSGILGNLQGVFGNLSAYLPLVWEIAQPMLLRYAVKKFKSLFTRKKKKKNSSDD